MRTGEMSFYKAKPGYAVPFFSDDQGFAAVRVNRTHAVVDVYVSNHLVAAATRVLAAADRPAPGSSGRVGSGGGGMLDGGGGPGALPAAGTTHGPGGRRRLSGGT